MTEGLERCDIEEIGPSLQALEMEEEGYEPKAAGNLEAGKSEEADSPESNAALQTPWF